MDWCGYFKEITERNASSEWKVYSNANPSRVWDHVKTIEFGRRGGTTTPYITGDFSQETNLTLFTRCENEVDAEAAATRVFTEIIAFVLDTLVIDEKIRGYKIDRYGVFADERGAAIGETFSGFVDFTIYEEIDG